MPSNNSKYTPEFREETAKYIIESGKSGTSVAEEIGIDKNTVCSWVRAYRKKIGMPAYAEEKGIQPLSVKEIKVIFPAHYFVKQNSAERRREFAFAIFSSRTRHFVWVIRRV